MRFDEINDIIDYYREQDCIIIRFHYHANTLIIETPDREIKTIRFQVHWDTNGNYFYAIK